MQLLFYFLKFSGVLGDPFQTLIMSLFYGQLAFSLRYIVKLLSYIQIFLVRCIHL
ncbi:hypothetical protein [Helicoverpa armigera nucleopolyhedrovirus]|uniref:Uncharacterized protein n=1 Tax=Helicoverpa armigera nucleopolyhedrovirus TaxID=51313 RepID=Q91BY3_9ABAC|nr:hypothetical protein [Helicoverpa armigera nucleopolyhedrovirus]AAK96276.1 unknown [Helicoverpa armigera nucleopolyhedrovirus]